MARTVQPYFAPTTVHRAARDLQASAAAEPSRALAGMLLAAVVAAVLVVADQLVDTWADGHLLLVWVALWSVAFAALALLAKPLRQLACVAAPSLARWSAARAQRRSDAIMWRVAQQDSRVMRELQLAAWHAENEV